MACDQHATFIVERLLEHGNQDVMRWLWHAYTAEQIVAVLRRSRALSRRSAIFWSHVFHLSANEVPCIQTPWHQRQYAVSLR